MSDAARSADGGGHGRIVVGIDGSPTSPCRALDPAARQAELTGAVLEPVIAWEWPTSYGWAIGLPADVSPANDAQKVLDDALGRSAPAPDAADQRPSRRGPSGSGPRRRLSRTPTSWSWAAGVTGSSFGGC